MPDEADREVLSRFGINRVRLALELADTGR